MKFLLTILIGFLFSPQLNAQHTEAEPVPYDKLKKTERETRSGGIISIYHYNDELYTGAAIEKKLTSTILYHFKNGYRHGKSTHYSNSNRPKKEWEYHKGMLRAVREWYVDGDLKSEANLNRKSRLKNETEWYRNGQIKQTNTHRRYQSSYKVKHYSKKARFLKRAKKFTKNQGRKWRP